MKKRALLVALSLIFVFSLLAGCNTPADNSNAGNTPATSDKPTTSNSPAAGNSATPSLDPTASSIIDPETPEYERDLSLSGTLKVWYDRDDFIAEITSRFNAIYPNIKLEFERVAHTEARGKMQLDGPAGTGADVFMIPHDHLGNAVLDGLVEPIDPTLQKKLEGSQVASAVKTVTLNGEMYGVPIVIENIALLYNKDLWGPNPPATMEEIIAFAKTYNDYSTGKWTMAWQVNDAYHNYHWLSVNGFEIFGPNHDDYRNSGFGSAEAIKGNEYIKYLRENLLDVPEADSNWDGSVARFQNGDLPLTISGPWAVADAKKNGVNFGVTSLPTVNGKQPVCFSGVRLACMSSFTEVPELATAFLDFLSSIEGATYFYQVEGLIPALKDATLVPGLANDEILMGFSKQTPYTVPMPIIPEVQAMWEGLRETFIYVWEKQLTPEEGAAKGMETYKVGLQSMGIAIDF